MARCSGPSKGPTPAPPPFDRSHGVAITAAPLSPARSAARHRRPADRAGSRRPGPPKRAAGTFRRPRPLATEGGEARHQLASPPSAAHLAASLGQRMAAFALRRCKIWIPLHGITLPASRGSEPRLSALPPGPCRAAPRSLPARTLKRHAASESLLPSAGRALRHSRAKTKRALEC